MGASQPPGRIETGPTPSRTTRAAPAEPDASTLERARRRDLRAFEALYRQHVGRVHALCSRFCGGDAGRAEDLVQEVFLRVWQRLGSFEGRSRFSTWVYRLAVNRCTDLLRAEMRRSGVQAQEDLGTEIAARAPSPAPDTGIDLEGAIRALPPGARLVFVLHDVEGYGHEEIAEMSGIAVGTSKSQLYRARRLLREMLSR